jgi:hypothetical protein
LVGEIGKTLFTKGNLSVELSFVRDPCQRVLGYPKEAERDSSASHHLKGERILIYAGKNPFKKSVHLRVNSL